MTFRRVREGRHDKELQAVTHGSRRQHDSRHDGNYESELDEVDAQTIQCLLRENRVACDDGDVGGGRQYRRCDDESGR